MSRPRLARTRSNGSHSASRRPSNGGRAAGRRLGRGAWLAPIIGATIIVVLAWAASLEQATPEVFVGASLVFALGEGSVLAFVGTVWSPRGLAWAVGVAVLTALLATPGRWELAYLRTGQNAAITDLLIDLGVTVAWGAFAGLAGATILRERLSRLLPNR